MANSFNESRLQDMSRVMKVESIILIGWKMYISVVSPMHNYISGFYDEIVKK